MKLLTREEVESELSRRMSFTRTDTLEQTIEDKLCSTCLALFDVAEAAEKFSKWFDEMSKVWGSYCVGTSIEKDMEARDAFYEMRKALGKVRGKP